MSRVLRSPRHLLRRNARGSGTDLSTDVHRYTYSEVALAKLYDSKTPIVAADLFNDRVLPFFQSHEVALSRVLTDRGTEYLRNRQPRGKFAPGDIGSSIWRIKLLFGSPDLLLPAR